jgi:wyosine [tRNA(Phe)-imidazoG37] synthetase (radical SAM superfamily)
MSFTYGPVPSRRLGFSLGVDLLPFKTCSFDCVYCQLGPTAKKTVRRNRYFSRREVLGEIRKILDSGKRIDHITFSGSGEPTLNKELGDIIKGIKKMTSIPVVVLTNSSLFYRSDVRKALVAADVVVPTLDAATQDTLRKVHRPHSTLHIDKIIDGLARFRREYKGKIWLEVMLVKGMNDRLSQLKKLKAVIGLVRPDKIQLNTVVRPPAEKSARALRGSELRKIQRYLGGKTEIVAEFRKKRQPPGGKNLSESIFSAVRRRPMTLKDLALSLGESIDEIEKQACNLVQEGKIQIDKRGTAMFLRHKRPLAC